MSSTLTNALFPVFLGVFIQYLFEFAPAGGAGPRLKIHVTAADAGHLIGFACYFFLDWVACLAVAPGAALSDRVFAFSNVATVVFLGLAMLSSIGALDQAFRFMWGYYIFALVADTAWIFLYIWHLPGPLTIGGPEIAGHGLPILLYLVFRAGLAVASCSQLPSGGSDMIRRVLFWGGVAIRPVGLLMLGQLAPGAIRWQ